jgi:hypothetical protein
MGFSCSSGSKSLDGSGATDAAVDRAMAKLEGGVDGPGMLVEASFPEVSLPDGACGEGAPCAAAVPHVLVSHQPTPAGIALDDAYVYWVDLGTYSASDAGSDAPSGDDSDGGADAGTTSGPYVGGRIERCAKAGCGDSPQLLAAGTWNGMSKLAVDGTSVYWLTTSQILACPVDGCPASPTVIWSGDGTLTDVAVDATGVYFTDQQATSVLMCPLSGCSGAASALFPDPLDLTTDAEADADAGAQALPPSYGTAVAIALDSGNVYFTTNAGFVLSCAESACGATLRVVAETSATTLQIAVDSANTYFTDFAGNAFGRVLSCPKSGCGTSPTVLVDGLSWPTGLAADSANVYFTELGDEGDAGAGGRGRVARCTASGCGDRATAVAGFVNEPLGIAVDSDGVYWADFGSAVSTTETDVGRVMVSNK